MSKSDAAGPHLDSAVWSQLEPLLTRFEDAWTAGQGPNLAEYLPAEDELRRVALVELVHTDLEYRLKAGEPARVEHYLKRFPELTGEPGEVVRLLLAEHTLRRRRESGHTLAEYRQRFPAQWADLAERAARLPADPLASAVDTAPLPNRGVGGTPAQHPDDTFEQGGSAQAPPIPGYEVLGEIGRGGMGVVYKARDVRLNRVVALKMILAGQQAGAQEQARFRAEAEVVARLRHPNLVQIFEVGDAAGCPFLSLEYIAGGSLAARLGGQPLPPGEAAALTETLARAIQAAHEQGVIHRDLKPANVLIGTDGEPKVTDFGLAKRLDSSSEQTPTGAILGTPCYMAPEQARGKSRETGAATDVYALGAILYECLTGRPPFRGETPLDTILQVMADEPVPPARLRPGVPLDINKICLKCLEKDPRQRYATAAELADDLRRFRAGEPVRARRPAAWERVVKWARRRPTAAALLGVSLVAALSLAAGAVWWHSAQEHEGAARAAQVEVGRQRKAREQEQEAARLLKEKTERERAQQRREQYTARLARVGDVWQTDAAQARDLLEDPDYCPRELRDFTWGLLYRLSGGKDVGRPAEPSPLQRLAESPLQGSDRGSFAVAFAPDGKSLALAGVTLGRLVGEVKLWDLTTGKPLPPLRGHVDKVAALAYAPDGRTLATAGQDRTVRLWDVWTGMQLRKLVGHTDGVRAVAFSPDGKTLASASMDRSVRLWDTATGCPRATLTGHARGVLSLAFSPDGTLASGSLDGTIVLWNVADGTRRGSLDDGQGVVSLAFAPDGKRLAWGSDIGWVRLAEVGTRHVIAQKQAHTGWVCSVAFSPDGKTLVSGADDGWAKFWDPHTGALRLAQRPRAMVVKWLAFAPDSRTLAVAYRDGKAALWLTAGLPGGGAIEPRTGFRGGVGAVWCLAYAPDGHSLAVGGSSGVVALRDAATFEKRAALVGHTKAVWSLAYAPDGKTLATASWDATVKLWDTGSAAERATLRGHTKEVWAVAFSSDGRTLASTGTDLTIRLWDAATGAPRATLDGYSLRMNTLAFAPRGEGLASGGYDNEVKLWDVAGGRIRAGLRGHGAVVFQLAYAPDGRTLASASHDRTVRLWDAATGTAGPIMRHTAHGGVNCVAFSANGKVLASGAWEKDRLGGIERDRGSVKLWDPATGRELMTLGLLPEHVMALAFAPNGTLAAGTRDGNVTVWDVPGAALAKRVVPLSGPVRTPPSGS